MSRASAPHLRAESAHISARLLAKNLQTATVAESPLPHLAAKSPEASELADVRRQYSTVRLHAGIGYITPNDEHQGRGPRICAARKRGLRHAR